MPADSSLFPELACRRTSPCPGVILDAGSPVNYRRSREIWVFQRKSLEEYDLCAYDMHGDVRGAGDCSLGSG
jgi:hypothetical protein